MYRLFLVIIAIFAICPSVPVALAAETGFSKCILPFYPAYGSYTVEGNPTARPGLILDSYVLKVTCNPGYWLSGDETSSCFQGRYSDLPECIPSCEWKSSTTVSCGVQSTCYMQQLRGSVDLRHGQWTDEVFCGRIPPVKYLFGGKAAREYELPWHAGIYSKLYNPYKQICGGSLVSTKVVISAAHCFWDDVNKQMPAENYAVAVGKIYRPWNNAHDKLAQKSDVSEIRIPTRFLGSAGNFQEDLALLVLASPVTFSDAVQPVCLDFDYGLDAQQLTGGAMGKVAGWGLVSQNGRASPTLQVANMPYIDIAECVADSDPEFRVFLSSDKICAGYTNGTAVCKGDSGGGLHFLLETENDARYYLRGVVSAAPKTEHLCSVYHWATFTHLLRHQHFIQDLLGEKLRVESLIKAKIPTMLEFADQTSQMPTVNPNLPYYLILTNPRATSSAFIQNHNLVLRKNTQFGSPYIF